MSSASLRNAVKKTNTNETLREASGINSNLDKIAVHLSMGIAKDVNIDLLEDYPEHKYTQYDKDKLKSLTDSINQGGLSQAITVWHDTLGVFEKNKYYIIAGHNRRNACKKLGWNTVPCIVKDGLTKAEADFLVQTNLDQRGQADLSLYDKCQNILQALASIKALQKENKLKEKSYGTLIENINEEKDTALHFGLKRAQIFLYKKLGENLPKQFFDLYPACWDLRSGRLLADLTKDQLKELAKVLKDNPIKFNENLAKELILFLESHDTDQIEDFIANKLNDKEKNKIKKKAKNNEVEESKNEQNKEIVETENNINGNSPFVIDLTTIPEFKPLMEEYNTKETVYKFIKLLIQSYSD